MQEFIQITRESALKLRRDDFIEVHRVTPEEAQVARAIVEQNLLIISYLFENMEIAEDQLDQISDDPQTLEKYSKMWNAMEANDAQTYRLLFDDIKLEPDLYCG